MNGRLIRQEGNFVGKNRYNGYEQYEYHGQIYELNEEKDIVTVASDIDEMIYLDNVNQNMKEKREEFEKAQRINEEVKKQDPYKMFKLEMQKYISELSEEDAKTYSMALKDTISTFINEDMEGEDQIDAANIFLEITAPKKDFQLENRAAFLDDEEDKKSAMTDISDECKNICNFMGEIISGRLMNDFTDILYMMQESFEEIQAEKDANIENNSEAKSFNNEDFFL